MNIYATCVRTVLVLMLPTGIACGQLTPQNIESIVKQHENSIFFLTGTIRYLCGQCTQEHSLRVMNNVVVANAQGLMLAGTAGPLADPEVEIRQVNLQVLMPDGTEVPVRVVLTDEDLGVMILALEKLEDAKRHVFQPLTLNVAVHAQQLDPLLLLRRHDQATGYALSTACVRVHAVETRPRRLYFSSGFRPGESLLPCFDAAGQLVALALGDQTAVSSEELLDLIAQIEQPAIEQSTSP